MEEKNEDEKAVTNPKHLNNSYIEIYKCHQEYYDLKGCLRRNPQDLPVCDVLIN
jgi:hypothetical protein